MEPSQKRSGGIPKIITYFDADHKREPIRFSQLYQKEGKEHGLPRIFPDRFKEYTVGIQNINVKFIHAYNLTK